MKKTTKELLAFSVLYIIGLGILILRIRLTQEVFYIFLLWNMFLATVPLLIVQMLPYLKQKVLQTIFLGIWFVFFPNAPYIVTDLLHLNYTDSSHFHIDLVLIGYCSFYGLVAGYYALQKTNDFLKINWRWDIHSIKKFDIILFFLTGFGMYIGRFQRWNSWDIVQAPQELFAEMFELIIHPIVHLNVWIFSFVSGLTLWLGYIVFGWKYIKIKNIFVFFFSPDAIFRQDQCKSSAQTASTKERTTKIS